MTEIPIETLTEPRFRAVPLVVPPALVGMLDASHRTGRPAWVDVDDPAHDDVREMLRLARLHCRKVDKSLKVAERRLPGGHIRIEFQMRDKRRRGSTP